MTDANSRAARLSLRQEALRFVTVSLLVSGALAALKVGLGWFSGSHALMVNAVYSLNDVLSSIGPRPLSPLALRPSMMMHPLSTFGFYGMGQPITCPALPTMMSKCATGQQPAGRILSLAPL